MALPLRKVACLFVCLFVVVVVVVLHYNKSKARPYSCLKHIVAKNGVFGEHWWCCVSASIWKVILIPQASRFYGFSLFFLFSPFIQVYSLECQKHKNRYCQWCYWHRTSYCTKNIQCFAENGFLAVVLQMIGISILKKKCFSDVSVTSLLHTPSQTIFIFDITDNLWVYNTFCAQFSLKW